MLVLCHMRFYMFLHVVLCSSMQPFLWTSPDFQIRIFQLNFPKLEVATRNWIFQIGSLKLDVPVDVVALRNAGLRRLFSAELSKDSEDSDNYVTPLKSNCSVVLVNSRMLLSMACATRHPTTWMHTSVTRSGGWRVSSWDSQRMSTELDVRFRRPLDLYSYGLLKVRTSTSRGPLPLRGL